MTAGTSFVQKLDVISGLVGDTPTLMFVTSTHWG